MSEYLEDAIKQFIASEMDLEPFRTRLHEEGSDADPYIALLTEYENSDWSEAELRTRVADQFTADRDQ